MGAISNLPEITCHKQFLSSLIYHRPILFRGVWTSLSMCFHNAAVEAARAGEAGAGFAVVADEVRNLAMRAAEAAKNTASLIEGTVTRIREGSEMVERTSAEFFQFESSANKMGELVGEISAASSEQAQGIEQVSRAVSEMDSVVQLNSSTAGESASASETMNAQAEHLKKYVAELIVLVSGANGNGNAGST